MACAANRAAGGANPASLCRFPSSFASAQTLQAGETGVAEAFLHPFGPAFAVLSGLAVKLLPHGRSDVDRKSVV
jgi:hypothetical protein